jgi:hypothetical protein
MLKVPAYPEKSFACGGDVLVPAVEFEHVRLLATGACNLYVEIHFVALRFCHASPRTLLWLRDERSWAARAIRALRPASPVLDFSVTSMASRGKEKPVRSG